MPMLETNRLSVRYGTKTIVDSLSFSVSEGQWLMIVGPNGAGKSTALSAITQGAPYTGSVLFEGQDVKKMKSALRAQAIGVLSQNHFVGYGFTVEEVVRLGRFAYSGGLLGRSQTEDAKHVEHALTPAVGSYALRRRTAAHVSRTGSGAGSEAAAARRTDEPSRSHLPEANLRPDWQVAANAGPRGCERGA